LSHKRGLIRAPVDIFSSDIRGRRGGLCPTKRRRFVCSLK